MPDRVLFIMLFPSSYTGLNDDDDIMCTVPKVLKLDM